MATSNGFNAKLFLKTAKTFGLKSYQSVSTVTFEGALDYYSDVTGASRDVVVMAIAYDLCVGGISSKRFMDDGGVVVFIPSVDDDVEPYKFQGVDFYKKFFPNGNIHLRQLGPFVKDVIFGFVTDAMAEHGNRVVENVVALYGKDFAMHYVGVNAVKEIEKKLDDDGDLSY